VDYYTHPPPDTTVIAADELGPVMPRTFAPPASWTPAGHRVKAPLTYSRGPDKTWIYGGLRIGDGQAVTCCAPSRNSAHWQAFLARLEQANPTGTIAVITDNLSSHSSLATRAWLAGHPRLQQVFIPKGACWLNLQEAWWRIFRRHALAGQTLANSSEIAQVTEVATAQLNAHASPWVWGRPPPPPRLRRRRFTYLL
jgi:transposase